MIIKLPIQPKQTVPIDYTDIVGRPVRFLLEIHYEAEEPKGDQFYIALHYDTPPQPSYVKDDPPHWLYRCEFDTIHNIEIFRYDEFLEDECALYSLTIEARCVDDQYLCIETQLFGLVRYDDTDCYPSKSTYTADASY
jgi:hypothetical protein